MEVYSITSRGRALLPELRDRYFHDDRLDTFEHQNDMIILHLLEEFGPQDLDQVIFSLSGDIVQGHLVDEQDTRRSLRRLYESGLVEKLER